MPACGPVMPENWLRGPVQYDVCEGHGGRVLHPVADAAARGAAPRVSETGAGTCGWARRPGRRLGWRVRSRAD